MPSGMTSMSHLSISSTLGSRPRPNAPIRPWTATSSRDPEQESARKATAIATSPLMVVTL